MLKHDLSPVKSKLYKIAVLLLLATVIGVVTFFGWPVYVEHAENTSLRTVSRHAHEITAVEVLRLSSTGESGPAGSYFIRYDFSRRGIAARQTLSGPKAAELVKLWGSIRFVTGYQAGCHDPGFVLRFLSDQRCVFEAAVCFDCENISWQAAPLIPSCRQMAPTSLDKKSSMEALKAFLVKLE